MKNYYLKPPNISWGFIFPVSWEVLFFIRSPHDDIAIIDILPGLMALSVLFGSTSMLAITITFERKCRSFERLLIAPISLNTLMMAKTSGAIIFGGINACIPLLMASFIIDIPAIHWIYTVTAIFFIACTSTFLGLFIAVSVSEVFEAQTFSNFFRFPMIFLCGLFLPIESLPAFLRPLSYMLPLTYGIDLLRGGVVQEWTINAGVSIMVLLVFSLLLFMLSIHNISKKWIQ
ncbi:ABC transporter permease [Chitinivibrio alkaliphilus]|uniref:Transport permease protein n=1 Tax=Chitinivibrio alkaliphilus ACht1 TaxID=1313304 RepID=U7D523_9BACT|nr:ABC transporter permease [Chitinivibrio alkaliphilus]ERP31043.1 ABC-2 type transporter, permease component [Chitinivibrio alkaliphilus ACht1]